MNSQPERSIQTPLRVAEGRYVVFHGGRECGEERWRLGHAGDHLIASGEHELIAPHPFPNFQGYRLRLTEDFRLLGMEVEWRVGPRVVRATHEAGGGRWRARLEYEGQTREQEGDFPDVCEVESTSPLFQRFILSRRDFALGGEHEFPVLRIGPPLMAVSPERMKLRCVERADVDAPWGRVAAKRYIVSLPPAEESEGYTFWADANDVMLESFEGPEPNATWMKLVEHRAW
ncbi:MAG TPA: hypothetical protein VL332_05140 [Candidatus Saccharimonadaceae bacterium]|jgi:hypothetical protein|nr:hypothetical protein [Candidatus Saccharimonadaceae bacterium]